MEDPALTEAKDLYKQGEDKFQTADYEEALALWKKAFAMLPDGEDTRAIRHALVYNIAGAHSKAYEVSRNPTHLRKAKILLENYRAEHRALYGDDPEAVKDRAEADDRIAELEEKIAASEAAGEVGTPLNDGGTSDGGQPTDNGTQPPPVQPPPPKPLTPKQQWEADLRANPDLNTKWVVSNKKMVTGAVLLGVSIVPLGISAATFATVPFWLESGFSGTGSIIVGSVFAAGAIGMIVPGAISLSRGVKGRKEVLDAKPQPTGRLVPMLTPQGGGVSWSMQF